MTTTLEPRPLSTGAVAAQAGQPLPDHVTTLPILILYPHSRCNCRCAMCDIWQAPGRDSLDPDRVAAEAGAWHAAGVRRVVLSGGEPLMHPRLWDLVAPLTAVGIRVTLLSTGLLLARHAAAIARHVDDVVVSLDGPPAVHDAIRRVPRAYQRLADGVAAVRAAAPTVTLSARCTVQRANCDALCRTVVTARSLELDRLSFLAADVSTEAFNRPGGWSEERQSDIALDVSDLMRLRQELDVLYVAHAADFASGFIAESPAKLERLHAYFAALLGHGPFPTVRCNAPWVSAVVEADGTVRPCFFHRPVGTWHEGTLLDAINGPQAVTFRSALDVSQNAVCQRCVCSLNLDVSAGFAAEGDAPGVV